MVVASVSSKSLNARRLTDIGTFTVLSQFSMLSLIACILYAIVAAFSAAAAKTANKTGQQAWHFKVWCLIAFFFVVLILSRLLGLEEMLRDHLRDLLEGYGLSSNRRAIQGPIIAVAISLFGAAAMMAVYWVSKRISGRRNIALAVAIGACGVMLATISMRTISLHAFDRLLYGALKLNWVGDIGASLVVLIVAASYNRIVRGAMVRRR